MGRHGASLCRSTARVCTAFRSPTVVASKWERLPVAASSFACVGLTGRVLLGPQQLPSVHMGSEPRFQTEHSCLRTWGCDSRFREQTHCAEMAVLVVEKVTWERLLKLRGQEWYRNYFVNPNCVITSWLGHLSLEQEIRDNGDFLVLK